MSQAQRFEKEIAANPQDVGARLVFADWLEEQGDPRGEFIRVQCQLDDTDERAHEYCDLKSRELQLIRQHNKGWTKDIRAFVKGWSFRGGMVERVLLNAEDFLKQPKAVFQLAPIRCLALRNAYPYLTDLAKCKELKKLSGLSLAHCGIGREGRLQGPYENEYYYGYRGRTESNNEFIGNSLKPLRKLLDSTYLKQINALDLSDNFVCSEGVQLLVEAELENLRSLDLRHGHVDASGIELLSKLSNLKHLRLSSSPNISHNYDEIGIGEVPIALAKLLPQLTTLGAGSCGLTLSGFAEMARLAKASKLESASFERTITWETEWIENYKTFSIFNDFWPFENLKHLDMSSCYLDSKQFKVLGERDSKSPLISFAANFNTFDKKVGEHIAKLPGFKNLKALSLDAATKNAWNDDKMSISKKEFQSLVLSDNLPQLSKASFKNHGLRGDVFDSQDAAEHLKRFWYLDLSKNSLNERSIKTLIEIGPWPRLALLNLRSNKLPKRAKEKLKAKFGYRVLV